MIGRILKNSTVEAVKDQVWCELVGEAVILNLKSGVYYGLNAAGARVWRLIQEAKTVGAVLEALLEAYDVTPERCESDLVALLTDLAARELLVIESETNGSNT